MGFIEAEYDYHGALVVVEFGDDEIVVTHPPGSPDHASGSLPSDPCPGAEDPRFGAVRIVMEKTGLDVSVTREFVTFVQEGTPTGTMLAHGHMATVTGGELLAQGPEGAAMAYSIDDLPEIVPIRVANKRTLEEYLRERNAN